MWIYTGMNPIFKCIHSPSKVDVQCAFIFLKTMINICWMIVRGRAQQFHPILHFLPSKDQESLTFIINSSTPVDIGKGCRYQHDDLLHPIWILGVHPPRAARFGFPKRLLFAMSQKLGLRYVQHQILQRFLQPVHKKNNRKASQAKGTNNIYIYIYYIDLYRLY